MASICTECAMQRDAETDKYVCICHDWKMIVDELVSTIWTMGLRAHQLYDQFVQWKCKRLRSESQFDEATHIHFHTFLDFIFAIQSKAIAHSRDCYMHCEQMYTIGNRKRRLFDLMKSTEMVKCLEIYTTKMPTHNYCVIDFSNGWGHKEGE